jgi:signal transduction histidine kinase
VFGRGVGDADAVLGSNCPLCVELVRGRKSLLLDRKTDDFTYIPIYAENREWLERTASDIVAPLLYGSELMGIVGLSRDRRDDAFTFEDVALLDRVTAHIAASLRSSNLAAQLAESRELELMSQLSSMILHDLKNYLTPLRLVARNLLDHRNGGDVAEVCAADLTRVTDRMETLVQTLKQLREGPRGRMSCVCPNQLVRDALAGLLLGGRWNGVKVDLRLGSGSEFMVDAAMLRRVIENVVTNACEVMTDHGNIVVETSDHDSMRGPVVYIEITDDGPGMSDDFVRNQLFRPFATTKPRGLGLGLYQCRSIVRAHGGEITVDSRLGKGTTFRIVIQSTGRPSDPAPEPILSDKVSKAVPVIGAVRGQQLFGTND